MKNIITIAVLLALMAGGGFLAWHIHGSSKDPRNVVIRILQDIPRSFVVLVTEEAFNDLSFDDSGFLLGTRHAQSSMIVRTHWGIDLKKITPGDVQIHGRHATVTIPDPEVLDVVPDLATWRIYTRRTGLQVIRELLANRTLHGDLLATAQPLLYQKPASTPGHRARAVARMNEEAGRLFPGTGFTVEFR